MTLVEQVQTILDETSGAVYWPLGQIYTALNEAQINFYPRLQGFETHEELYLVAGVNLVSIPIFAIMVPKFIVGQTGTYFVTTHERLEQFHRTWRTDSPGYPKHYVLWDHANLRPFPKPDKDYTVDLYGIPWPEEISATLTDISFDSQLKLALAHRAAASLMFYSMPAFAQESLKESERLFHDFQVRQRNSQGDHIMHLRPGTTFTAAQSGSIRIGKRLN